MYLLMYLLLLLFLTLIYFYDIQAELVYAHYGTWDDFASVASSQDLEGKVVLVRSGMISLEDKVRSATSISSVGIILSSVCPSVRL